MSNPNIAEAGKATRFQPGQSGNPAGMPIGTLKSLRGDFVAALATHFREKGPEAIEKAYQESPLGYLKVIATVIPKELEIHRPLDELSDIELAAVVAAMRAIDAAQGARAGAGEAQEREQAGVVPALREAD